MLYEEMRRMEGSHRCAVCHAPLVTIWGGLEYLLVCGQDKKHEGFERKPTMAQEYQERERQMEWARPLADMDAEEIEDLFR